MKRRLVIATSRATEEQLKRLSRFAQVYELIKIPENDLDSVLPTMELMLLHSWPSIITEDRVRKMRNLSFIQSALAGVNHIPFHLLENDVMVCSAAGAYSDEVGEYAWALALAGAKKIVRFDSALKSGTWVDKPPLEIGKEVMVLNEKVIGILGYGGIGKSIARMARTLGMRVLAFSRKPVREKDIRSFHGKGGLGRLLSSSDLIFSTLPLSKSTDRLIGSGELSMMKRDAILVNIGRAEVMDQASLYEHLAKNPGFVYATDVWWLKNGKEELPPAYPFLSLPNFIGTPHASGPSAALTGKPMEFAVANTLRFLKGQKPTNIVNKSEYQKYGLMGRLVV